MPGCLLSLCFYSQMGASTTVATLHFSKAHASPSTEYQDSSSDYYQSTTSMRAYGAPVSRFSAAMADWPKPPAPDAAGPSRALRTPGVCRFGSSAANFARVWCLWLTMVTRSETGSGTFWV